MKNEYYYTIKNEKLKKMVEDKASELNISVYQLIWEYIGRGLNGDNFDEDTFYHLHSVEHMDKTNKALNIG